MDFGTELSAILSDYTKEIAEKVDTAVLETAKEMQKELKEKSPIRERGGQYAKNWKIKYAKTSMQETSATVYNAKYYYLTHLLENGHAKRKGGRVAGKPHIAPAERNAIERFQRRIEDAVKGSS